MPRGRPKGSKNKQKELIVENNTTTPKKYIDNVKKEVHIPDTSFDLIEDAPSFVEIPENKEKVFQQNNDNLKTNHELIINSELNKFKCRRFRIDIGVKVEKPNINSLEDAIEISYEENGRTFRLTSFIGEKVLIEYPQKWRTTDVWLIQEINQETGNVKIKNLNEQYYSFINFITGPTVYGLKIKKVNENETSID